MKKLVYILHEIKTGGVEVALLSAIPKLNLEFDLSVIVLGPIDDKLLKDLKESEKSVFISYNYKLWLYPFIIPYVVMAILKLKPDIIVSSLWRASCIGTITKILSSRIRYFAFIHNTVFFHTLDRFFSTWAMNNADTVLTDSKSSFNFVKSYNSQVNIRIISFLTNPTPILHSTLFEKGNKEIKLLSLGRLNFIKNIPASIEAIAYLRNGGINVVLDIYGRDDGAMDEVIAAIEEHRLENIVTLKGEISHTKRFDLFSNYHGVIQFSIFEGMAMSIVEAMQYGLVAFVTPVGEIPNYSEDLLSAVYIDLSDEFERINSFEKIKNVLLNKNLCLELSYNAQDGFKDKTIYADSLIENLLLA